MIPSYIQLALVAMVLVGIADFTYGRATRRGITPGTMTSSQACFFVPATGLWAYLQGVYAWTPPALLGVAAGLLTFLGFWAFMRSVALGQASVTTPIYRISFVVTALAAILFLGEPMTARKGTGFALAGAAIFLLSEFGRRKRAVPGVSPASIAWAVAAMTSVGLLNVVYKVGVSAGTAPAMLLHSQGTFFILIAFGYAFFAQGGPRFSRAGWAHSLVTGACLLTGLIALLAAYRTGEASVVTPIAQLSFVVSALLATLWMGERLTPRKMAGMALAAAAILAFTPV
ncbi:MAG: DMT family transporter [Candidatus Tectomicrobia bacterium]|uniref:DMT family transporter n=1 Tax=Tectimicrobiota bacterium TaxID=2528274 RepID=A0A932I272_UNCTE|nr:DMT family transporter [Candidatus Tectomicrobia bacterium]